MSNDAIQPVEEIQPVDEVQPVDEISTSKEHLDEWVLEMEARLISHETRPSKKIEKRPSIFGNWQCWDDFGASFIPEIQKWQFVACMMHWFGLNLRSYLEYMQGKEDLAWSYYRVVDEKFRGENNKLFVEHLLVQSCFLIFAMVFLSGEDFRKVIVDKMNDDQNSFPKGLTANDIQNIVDFLLVDRIQTKCYMLTMNFQIPWFVVEAVYTELSNLSKLLLPQSTKLHSHASKNYVQESTRLNWMVVPFLKVASNIYYTSSIGLEPPDGKYLLLSQTKSISRFHIPKATQLHLSQIVFVKDEGGSIDVSYSDNMRLFGVMQLTPWHLFQYIPKLYESLLRFERDYMGLGKPFTAYVACMSCLLKTEVDVRVLRENGVIPSTPFDDKDVLRCVQELKTFIPDGLRMPNELIILEEKVIAHYQRSAYRVYGEFKRRYCSNPWITISFIAGICLFVLTLIQTVLSFIQTKYSVPSNKKL